MAPDSVAVNFPEKIPPSMIIPVINDRKPSKRIFGAFLKGIGSPFSYPLLLAIMYDIVINPMSNINAGTIPARNKDEIDTPPAAKAYKIILWLGGMITP